MKPEAHIEPPAVFSPCRRWRYELWRRWEQGGEFCMFIGLNPSTADETQDDPTVRRCINFAKAWGFSALCMTNAFAWRDTDPAGMKSQPDPVGPENDETLLRLSRTAGVVVAAWGLHGAHLNRDQEIIAQIGNLKCLRVTKDGFPAHPLYLPKHLKPFTYRISR